MNTISSVDLQISIEEECPLCEHYFNLFDIESLIDDGHLYQLVLSDKGFGGEDLNIKFDCPNCKNEITIKDVVW